MSYAILDEATLIKSIYNKLTEIGLPVIFENPDIDAKFPVIVLQAPTSRPMFMGAAWDISVTVEVWADKYFDPSGMTKKAADYFTQIKAIMQSLNFQCARQIPAFTDIVTEKVR